MFYLEITNYLCQRLAMFIINVVLLISLLTITDTTIIIHLNIKHLKLIVSCQTIKNIALLVKINNILNGD